MKMRARVCLALLVMVACSNPMAPPDFGQPLEAPPQYRTWFQELETCSGLTGDFDKIHFYTKADVRVGGVEYSGYWYLDGDEIVIKQGLTDYEALVKHEELHALTQSGAHPLDLFDGKCGDLIHIL